MQLLFLFKLAEIQRQNNTTDYSLKLMIKGGSMGFNQLIYLLITCNCCILKKKGPEMQNTTYSLREGKSVP